MQSQIPMVHQKQAFQKLFSFYNCTTPQCFLLVFYMDYSLVYLQPSCKLELFFPGCILSIIIGDDEGTKRVSPSEDVWVRLLTYPISFFQKKHRLDFYGRCDCKSFNQFELFLNIVLTYFFLGQKHSYGVIYQWKKIQKDEEEEGIVRKHQTNRKKKWFAQGLKMQVHVRISIKC